MALGDPYITADDLKAYLEIPDDRDDARIQGAVEGARQITEDYCLRQFNDSGSATARRFLVPRHKAIVDDFSTTTGLIVRVGSISTGFNETWVEDTDFFIGPINTTRNERPEPVYWRIETIWGQCFPYLYRREPNLEVVARWGWSSVPENVVEANKILGAKLFRRKDSPEGVLGGFEGNPIRVGFMMDPDAERLLKRYRKHQPGRFGV